jgi:signal peptidase
MERIFKWLTNLMLVLVVLAVLLGLVVPAAIGSRALVVFSGSMEPALHVGGLAFIRSADPATVSEGDIIAYGPEHDPSITVCHRVVEVMDSPEIAFRTKGDANEDPDPWDVPAAALEGKVNFSVPYAGYVLHHTGRYVRTKLGLALLVALPTLILLGGTIADIRQWKKARGQQQQQQQQVEETS